LSGGGPLKNKPRLQTKEELKHYICVINFSIIVQIKKSFNMVATYFKLTVFIFTIKAIFPG
jgi:hypothetical protein